MSNRAPGHGGSGCHASGRRRIFLQESGAPFYGYACYFSDARDEATDKLAGLGLGADDYIIKPFMPQELLLRIHAVLRRCYKQESHIVNLQGAVAAFYGTVTKDYGEASPRRLWEKIAADSSNTGISEEVRDKLRTNGVWAMFLSPEDECVWTVDLPPEMPTRYQVQGAAVFSKGYLEDYPVFVWGDADGLLVLGYPKGSYTRFTGNYYATAALKNGYLFYCSRSGACYNEL